MDGLGMMSAGAGWVGAVSTMGAYGLVSQGRLNANSLRYQLVNALGAALLAVSALSADNWPSVAANLVWLLIALLSLVRAPRSLARAFLQWARRARAHSGRGQQRRGGVLLRPGR